MRDLYIERQADYELYDRLRRGQYSYILSPPQTGKTLLLYQVASKLKAKGIKCAVICLKTTLRKNPYIQEYLTTSYTTNNDNFKTPLIKPTKEYYWQIIDELASQLNLNKLQSYKKFRQINKIINPKNNSNILLLFLKNILLEEINDNQRIVIFVDEIDELIDLHFFPKQFSRYILNTIKFCYDQQKKHPDTKHTSEFNRLTFALFGETSAYEIAKDYSNIFDNHLKVKLNDFDFYDLERIKIKDIVTFSQIEQISDKFEDWKAVLRAIFSWTNGQPLLTNNLLSIVIDPDNQDYSKIYLGDEKLKVKQQVEKIIRNTEVLKHLNKVKNNLLGRPELLQIYQNILQQNINGYLNFTPKGDLIRKLISLGIVIKTRNGLVIHNLIYQEYIFNYNWIQKSQSFYIMPNNSQPNSQPPKKQRKQSDNRQQDAQGAIPTDSLESVGRDFATFLVIFSQLITLLTGTGILFGTWLNFLNFSNFFAVIIAAFCFLVIIVLQLIRNQESFRKIINNFWKTIKKYSKYLPIFVIGILIFSFLGLFITTSQIQVEAKNAEDFFNNRSQLKGLEKAIESGNKLNINWISKSIYMRNKLQKYPKITLETITSKIREENIIYPPNLDEVITVAIIDSEGEKIATGSADENIGKLGGTLQIWDISGKQIGDNIKTEHGIYSMDFDRKGQKIALGEGVGCVELYNLIENKIEKLPLDNSSDVDNSSDGQIRSISFSSDSKYLVAGGSNSKAYLWNLENDDRENKPVRLSISSTQKDAYIYDVAFSHNNQIIATVSGGNGNVIKLWNLDGKQIGEHSFDMNNDVPFSVSFNQDDTKVVVGFKGGNVGIWTLEHSQNKEEHKLTDLSQNFQIYKSSNRDTNPFINAKFKENKLIVISENKKTLKYNEYVENKSENQFESIPHPIVFNTYGLPEIREIVSAFSNHKINKLITVSRDGKAQLWNLSLDKNNKNKLRNTGLNYIKKIAISLAVNQTQKQSYKSAFLDDKALKILSLISNSSTSLSPNNALEKHGVVTDTSFTPDGNELATVGQEGVIRFWNTDDGKYSRKIDTGLEEIASISFNAVEKYVVVASAGGVIKKISYLDDSGGKIIAKGQGIISFMEFSPDGQYLITLGNKSPQPKLWDLSKFHEGEKSIEQKPLNIKIPGDITGLGFLTNELIVVSTDGSNQLQIISTLSHIESQLFPLSENDDGAIGISFNKIEPNLFNFNQIHLVATAQKNGKIKIWNEFKKDKPPINEFSSKLVNIKSISLSPDGKFVVVGGDDGKIEIFYVSDLQQNINDGCSWLKNYHETSAKASPKAKNICQNYL